jgi:AhpD family alkylhydroperoxidase
VNVEENAIPNTMKVLTAVSPKGAQIYPDHKAAVMENPELRALPANYKLPVGIGVAAAPRSNSCAIMQSKMAKQAGATQAEIAEAILAYRAS